MLTILREVLDLDPRRYRMHQRQGGRRRSPVAWSPSKLALIWSNVAAQLKLVIDDDAPIGPAAHHSSSSVKVNVYVDKTVTAAGGRTVAPPITRTKRDRLLRGARLAGSHRGRSSIRVGAEIRTGQVDVASDLEGDRTTQPTAMTGTRPMALRTAAGLAASLDCLEGR